MGFRFTAIATSDRFSKEKIGSFSVRFFCGDLVYEKDVSFEESCDLNYKDEYLDILFLETGTLIFGSNPSVTQKLNAKKNSFMKKVATFNVEETSRVCMVDYFENMESLISFVEHNGQRIDHDIKITQFEFKDGLDLTVKLIDHILQKDFSALESDMRLSRFRFAEGSPNQSEDDRRWLLELEKFVSQQNETKSNFSSISPFKNGIAVARLNGKYGLINEDRTKISRFKYDRIENFEGDTTTARFQIHNKWGHLNLAGEEIIPAEYDEIGSFRGGLACAKQAGKFGFIDLKNNVVIPFIYEGASPFSQEFTTAKLNGNYGIIDKTGKEMTGFIYKDTWGYNRKFTFVYMNNTWAAIDVHGTILKSLDYESIFDPLPGAELVNVQRNGKWGCMDRDFNLIIDCLYNEWIIFFEGLAQVNRFLIRKDDMTKPFTKASFINLKGIEIVPYIYDQGGHFSEGLASVSQGDKWGFIDIDGKLILPLIYDNVREFKNGSAEVVKNGKRFKIDRKGELVE